RSLLRHYIVTRNKFLVSSFSFRSPSSTLSQRVRSHESCVIKSHSYLTDFAYKGNENHFPIPPPSPPQPLVMVPSNMPPENPPWFSWSPQGQHILARNCIEEYIPILPF